MTAHDVQIAATEPETGAVPEPAHGAEIMVPLNRLKASPRNARKVTGGIVRHLEQGLALGELDAAFSLGKADPHLGGGVQADA